MPPIPSWLRRAVVAWVLPSVVGIGGAWLSFEAFGAATAELGPFRISLDADFGPGVTDIALPPLGRLRANTHSGPLQLRATLRGIDVDRLRTEFQDRGLNGVTGRLEQGAIDELPGFALKVFGLGVGGGLILGFLVYHTSFRRVEVAFLAALLAMAGSIGLTVATYDARAFLSPAYEGSLSLAPRLFGPVEGTLERVDYFREQIQRVVAGAARAYAAIDANPFGEFDEIRVLHISDIHLSTLGMDFASQLARSFDVDVVLDTGDTGSFGTSFDTFILQRVTDFQEPYVWVRGNHDSLEFQRAIARLPNSVVLDSDVAEVEGITFYGLGNPYFTGSRGDPASDDEVEELVRSAGPRILADLENLASPPDVVAVHDARMAEAVAGIVPLVVSGHFHRGGVRVVDGTVFLEVGTAGGAGPTGFTAEGDAELAAEILYFQPPLPGEAPALVGWDRITQDPETGNLEITRHLVETELGSPSPSPSASVTATPTGTTG